MFCDGAETCDAGLGCQSGIAPDCSGRTDQCNVGVCDDAVAACVAAPMPDGTACDDGDGCAGDTCQAGICEPETCDPPSPAPSPPTKLKGGFDEKVELGWEGNEEEPGVTGYNVYRSTATGGPYSRIAAVAGLETTEYVDEPGNGRFCYVVTARDASGVESDYSNEVCGVIRGTEEAKTDDSDMAMDQQGPILSASPCGLGIIEAGVIGLAMLGFVRLRFRPPDRTTGQW